MRHRTHTIEELENAIGREDWMAASDALFRALYAASSAIGLELARAALARSADHFSGELEPDVATLLHDPPAWERARGLAVPDANAETSPAAASFMCGVDALLLAAHYNDRPGVVARALATAIGAAIEAAAVRAWERDDPDALAMWRGLNDAPCGGQDRDEQALRALQTSSTRCPASNPAAQRERRRCWNDVVSEIHKTQLSHEPPVSGRAARVSELHAWRADEYLPAASKS